MAIGLGQPKHARQFGGKLAPSVTCITNETPELYDIYGIGQGNMLRLIAPDAIKAGARAASKGFTQGSATGDQRRLAATFIIDSDGVVRYAHYSKHAGDHPDLTALLDQWANKTRSESAA